MCGSIVYCMPYNALNTSRYPVVERAVTDLSSFSDTSFSATLRENLSQLLRETRSGDAAEGAHFRHLSPLHRTNPVKSPIAQPKDAAATQIITEQPILRPLQTQTSALDGSTTPLKEDESNTRSVHFNGHDSDSDSAMQESPVSEHGAIEINDVQLAQAV